MQIERAQLRVDLRLASGIVSTVMEKAVTSVAGDLNANKARESDLVADIDTTRSHISASLAELVIRWSPVQFV